MTPTRLPQLLNRRFLGSVRLADSMLALKKHVYEGIPPLKVLRAGGPPTVQLSRLVGLVFGVLLAATAVAAPSPSLTGQVERVVDGNTIAVRVGHRTETVRYIGMNAPELDASATRKQSGGREAAEANRQLVEGQTVRLELDVQERDRDGRLLAYVYVGDFMVNAELVAQGFAKVTTVPPNVKHQELFLKLQREARLLQLGLWRGASPPLPDPGSSSTPLRQVAQSRPGVPPQDAWTCPLTHPIKGNFTTYSGERCIYHMNGGEFFNETNRNGATPLRTKPAKMAVGARADRRNATRK